MGDKSISIEKLAILGILVISLLAVPSFAAVTTTVNSPSNNSWTNDNTFDINLTFSTDQAGNITFSVILISNGTVIANSSVTNNTAIVVTTNAISDTTALEFNITANDTASNFQATNRTISIDTVPPSVQVSLDQNNTWTPDNTPTIIANYTDRSPNASVTIRVASNGTAVGTNASVSNNTNANITINASQPDGSIIFYINVTDLAGNINGTRAFRNFTFRIDTTAPNISIDTSLHQLWYNSSNITGLGNFTDALANNASCDFTVDGTNRGRNASALNFTQTNISLNITIGDTNTSQLRFICTDNAGNIANSSNVTLYIDNTTPIAVLGTTLNGSTYTQTSGSFVFSVSVSELFIRNCTYSLNSATRALAPSGSGLCTNSTTFTIESTTEGNNSLAFQVLDYGNKLIDLNLTWIWTRASVGGGGGGGASAGSGASGLVIERFGYTPANTLLPVRITDGDVRVTKVDVFVTIKTDGGSVSIQKLITKPSILPDAPGKIHQYVEITHSLPKESFMNPVVEFKVPKAFLDSNNIKANEIGFYRWADAKWNLQETEMLGTDIDYVLYRAKLQGFSTFAISTQDASVISATTGGGITGTVASVTEPLKIAGETPITIGQAQMPMWLLGLLAIVVIVVLYYMFKGMRRRR